MLGIPLSIFPSESGGSTTLRPGVGDDFAVAGCCAAAGDVCQRAKAVDMAFLSGGMPAVLRASASSLADVPEISSPSKCGGKCPGTN